MIRRPTEKSIGISSLLVVAAALCWGLSGGIGAILLADGWDAFLVAFYRGAIGLLFVVVWLAMRPAGSGLHNPRLWFWSTIAGLGVAGNFLFYFVSIAEGSVAVAATLMYCAPVFVYLVSFILRLEIVTWSKLGAIAAVMVGIVLLTGVHDIESRGITTLGVGAGLLAGLSYAVFILGFKFAAPHGSSQTILVIAFAVLITVLVWPADAGQVISVMHSADWPLFLVLGVLGAGLSFTIYVVGIRYTAPTVASVVAMVEPVSAALFGFVVLGERLAVLQLVGMGLILITATVLSVNRSSR